MQKRTLVLQLELHLTKPDEKYTLENEDGTSTKYVLFDTGEYQLSMTKDRWKLLKQEADKKEEEELINEIY